MNESKQLGEKFQNAAEKAEERMEKMSEGYERNTKTEVANLQSKFSDCNHELERKSMEMLPASVSGVYGEVNEVIYVDSP